MRNINQHISLASLSVQHFLPSSCVCALSSPVHHLLFRFSLFCGLWMERKDFCVFGSGKSQNKSAKSGSRKRKQKLKSIDFIVHNFLWTKHEASYMDEFYLAETKLVKKHLCLKRCELWHELCASLLGKGSERKVVLNLFLA